jgi:16S rRNA (cytidine1402-2'-O)-methyltransferase
MTPAGGGRLSVVGTPIGNLLDLSPRALRTLSEADVIAAEDTRRTGLLLARHGIRKPLVSYFEGNEQRRAEELCRRVRAGEHVALVSEAGMPAVSDPGFRLVRACIDADLPVTVVPGPSAVLAALCGSGLPPSDVRFIGFLPRAAGRRRARIAELRDDRATLVLFEAPGRLASTLGELCELFGDRPAAVARELTKVHEEFVRGRLSDLRDRFAQDEPRGEVTLVVEGSRGSEPAPADDALTAAVRAALRAGATPRDVYRLAVDISGSMPR